MSEKSLMRPKWSELTTNEKIWVGTIGASLVLGLGVASTYLIPVLIGFMKLMLTALQAGILTAAIAGVLFILFLARNAIMMRLMAIARWVKFALVEGDSIGVWYVYIEILKLRRKKMSLVTANVRAGEHELKQEIGSNTTELENHRHRALAASKRPDMAAQFRTENIVSKQLEDAIASNETELARHRRALQRLTTAADATDAKIQQLTFTVQLSERQLRLARNARKGMELADDILRGGDEAGQMGAMAEKITKEQIAKEVGLIDQMFSDTDAIIKGEELQRDADAMQGEELFTRWLATNKGAITTTADPLALAANSTQNDGLPAARIPASSEAFARLRRGGGDETK